MAQTPQSRLEFYQVAQNGCLGCADRLFDLPNALPPIGDDFDWSVRDFDGFKRFLLEELAARFPERRRWTPADLEVVIVEILAAELDRLSDMADRVFAESYLETARNPASLRRLLKLIDYDAATIARADGKIDFDPTTPQAEVNRRLERFWASSPYEMEAARRNGPKAIREQHRMVSLSDYAERMEDHPLVLRASSEIKWTGSWSTVFVATILWDNELRLDDPVPKPDADLNSEFSRQVTRLRRDIEEFHSLRNIPVPNWSADPTIRTVLRPYLDLYRQAGQEVVLLDSVPVPITLILSVNVNRNYFTSEVRLAARQVLGKGAGAFFEPGRLKFGEDLFASDVIAALMELDGVDNVCLIRFKRTGADYPDETASGRIGLNGLEVAICENIPGQESRGYIRIKTNGGMQ